MPDQPSRRNTASEPRALEGASIYPVFAVNRPLPAGTAVPPRGAPSAPAREASGGTPKPTRL